MEGHGLKVGGGGGRKDSKRSLVQPEGLRLFTEGVVEVQCL